MKASVSVLWEQARKDPIKNDKFRALLKEKNISGDTIPHFSTLHVEIVSILKKAVPIEKFDGGCAIKIAELEAIFMPNSRDANQEKRYEK